MISNVPSRFRWAFCQLEALRHCLVPRVRHMLKEMPETLDETYERILRDINKANRDLAHRLLQCLTVAVRPLRVAELAEVLAVEFGSTSGGGSSRLNTDWRWEDHREAVLSTCSSLISVVAEDGGQQKPVLSTSSSSVSFVDEDGGQVVQFSHFSVKEFLTSSRIGDSSAGVSRFHILLEPAHTFFAKACLGVLLRLGEPVDGDNIKEKFPLARYAAEHWVDHARFESVSSHIREGMEDLFDPDKPHFAAWIHVYDLDTPVRSESALFWFGYYGHKEGLNAATPLYYAALCGLHDVTEQLIVKCPHQVNTTGGCCVSPLGAALSGGYLKIAQLLYERGADVNVQGRQNRTLLRSVSITGHLEVVQWLLSHGANPTVWDEDTDSGWTSLHGAAFYGHVDISRLLLQYKADIHARDNEGRTPLHEAARFNMVDTARFLLENGADVNARDNSRRTPLHVASYEGYLDIARLLVELGANIDAEDNKGRTTSQLASESRKHDIVKFLSDHGSK